MNKLGSRGYRVVGFTITADEKLAWTLELKNFEIPWKSIRKQCRLWKKNINLVDVKLLKKILVYLQLELCNSYQNCLTSLMISF